MMAAYSAGLSGAGVVLLEKNEKLGKKLFITGKGRCNVCNAAEDVDFFFSNIMTNPKFLYSSFYRFDNNAVMKLFEDGGCPLKVERGGRVFPVSDHSSDIIGTLKRLMDRVGVKVMLNTTVKRICTDENGFCSVETADGKVFFGDACIVCCGGFSYAGTGSTGDGYDFAREMGHRVTELSPALVPFETVEAWPGEMMGLSLKNISLRMMQGKKKLYEGFGEMMFSHFGVTGPLVLTASSYLKSKGDTETRLFIDLKPGLNPEQLDRRLIREFEENRAKQFKNTLGALFPTKLIPIMVKLSGIDSEKKASEIGREERQRFAELIKNLPLTVRGTRGFPEAIVTRGGISVKEVNPSTMESKLVPGVYFAGEILDLDALTGGFNLQIAWSTGFLAGESAAAE